MKTNARENSVSALLVGAYEQERRLLQDIFGRRGWKLFEAHDRPRALRCLERAPIHVVITETNLPEWDWKGLLQDLRGRQQPPQLIVTSRHADEYLWAEALNEGAYDVLAQPFERDEVERVVASARRHFDPVEISAPSPGTLTGGAS